MAFVPVVAKRKSVACAAPVWYNNPANRFLLKPGLFKRKKEAPMAEPVETDCEKNFKSSKTKCFDALFAALAEAGGDAEKQGAKRTFSGRRWPA
jgi:hypothetical protein